MQATIEKPSNAGKINKLVKKSEGKSTGKPAKKAAGKTAGKASAKTSTRGGSGGAPPSKKTPVVCETPINDARYELNMYYGVQFPDELLENVEKSLSSQGRYRKLVGDGELEITIKTNKVVLLLNDDSAFSPLFGYILVDGMTKSSDTSPEAAGLNIQFNPTELLKLEREFADGVAEIDKIHEILVRDLKKSNNHGDVKQGWFALISEWDGSEETSELS